MPQREAAVGDDRAETSQSDDLGAAFAGQIDRALHERHRGVAREGEKFRWQVRQHDQFAIGNPAVRGLDRELIERERFDKLGDARPQSRQLLVAEWLQRRIEAAQVAGGKEMNDECEAGAVLRQRAPRDGALRPLRAR